MTRHADIMTTTEVCEYLGISKRDIPKMGIPHLPQFGRPYKYSRQICDEIIEQRKAAAWASIGQKTPPYGGTDSRSTARKFASQQEREIVERLKSKSAAHAAITNSAQKDGQGHA